MSKPLVVIRCRRSDASAFKDHGFNDLVVGSTAAIAEMSATLELTDLATCALATAHIPYYGEREGDETHGPVKFACDGNKTVEVSVDGHGKFAVNWNTNLGQPTLQSVREVNNFLNMNKRVKKIFDKYKLAMK